MVLQLTAILSMIDAVLGSETAQKVLALFKLSPALTDEQKANLDANYQDYVERIAARKADQ